MISLVSLVRAARVSIECLATGQEPSKGEMRGAEPSEYVHLSSNSVRGAVGRGSVQSRQIVDYLAFKADWMHRRIGIDPKSLMLIEAVSDSMAPAIEEGCWLTCGNRDFGTTEFTYCAPGESCR